MISSSFTPLQLWPKLTLAVSFPHPPPASPNPYRASPFLGSTVRTGSPAKPQSIHLQGGFHQDRRVAPITWVGLLHHGSGHLVDRSGCAGGPAKLCVQRRDDGWTANPRLRERERSERRSSSSSSSSRVNCGRRAKRSLSL